MCSGAPQTRGEGGLGPAINTLQLGLVQISRREGGIKPHRSQGNLHLSSVYSSPQRTGRADLTESPLARTSRLGARARCSWGGSCFLQFLVQHACHAGPRQLQSRSARLATTVISQANVCIFVFECNNSNLIVFWERWVTPRHSGGGRGSDGRGGAAVMELSGDCRDGW